MTHEQAVEQIRALIGARSGLAADRTRYAERSADLPAVGCIYVRVVDDVQVGQPDRADDGDIAQLRRVRLQLEGWGAAGVAALRLAMQRIYAEGAPPDHEIGLEDVGAERNATIRRSAGMLPVLRMLSAWLYVRTSTGAAPDEATGVGLSVETDDLGPLTEDIPNA